MINLTCPQCHRTGQIECKPTGFIKLDGCDHMWATARRYGFVAEPTEDELDALADVLETMPE